MCVSERVFVCEKEREFVSVCVRERDWLFIKSLVKHAFSHIQDPSPPFNFQMQDNDIDKYKPVEGQHEAQNFGEENLKKFVDDFLAGNVPQHYLTEKLPEDWNKTPVKVNFML